MSKEMKKLRRSALLGSAATLVASFALGVGVTSASAQDADAEEFEDLEEVTVTGSRIKRAGFDTMQPAVVLDAEFLKERAFNNVADALNEIPAFGVPGNTGTGGQSSQSVGQEFVNFFGVGSQRTLTLVNGRRFVSSNSPTNFAGANPGLQVDLSIIPTALVERIETVAVGGAPIYGSDAIAGTVNVILKKDYEGMEVNAEYGTTEQGDMDSKKVSAIMGGNFDDGKGNAVISMEWAQRDGLVRTDREYWENGAWSFQPRDGIRALIPGGARVLAVSTGGIPTSSNFYAAPAFGTYLTNADGDPVHFGPDGNLVPFDPGDPYGVVWTDGGDGLNLSETASLQTPTEKYLVSANGRYEVADNVDVFLEMFYAKSEGNELVNQPHYQSRLFGFGNSGTVELSVDNPFLTDQARAILVDNLGEDGVFYLHRASMDYTGAGKVDSSLDLFRYVVGAEGEFDLGDRTWSWDVSYNYGQSRSRESQRDVLMHNFGYAVNAVTDPDTGEIVCAVQLTDQNHPANDVGQTSVTDPAVTGCVPINLFGNGAPSQEAIDYLTTRFGSETEIQQQVFEANITGTLFDLPAGEVAVAAGVLHRRESSSFIPDGQREEGLGRSVAFAPVFGDFDTNEAYVEAIIPVISPDMDMLIEAFDSEGAIRNVDNSRSGSDWTWTLGGKIDVVDGVRIRGNFTRSIRSPQVTELFLPTVEIFSFATDPCDQGNYTGGENAASRTANCTAELGALGLDPESFQSTVQNASKRGLTTGSPNLLNEKADAWTIGTVLQPEFIPGLRISLDWTDIKLTNAIENLDLTSLMQACYDSSDWPNVPACDNFSRDSAGQVNEYFRTGYTNAGFFEYAGLQAIAEYTFEAGQLFEGVDGDFTIATNFYYLDKHELSVTGSDLDIDAHEIGRSKYQVSTNLRYVNETFSVLFQNRWISSAKFNNDWTLEDHDQITVDDYFIFNAAGTYNITENLTARLSIDNLFDVKVPYGSLAGGNAITTYDVFGRRYKFGITARF